MRPPGLRFAGVSRRRNAAAERLFVGRHSNANDDLIAS